MNQKYRTKIFSKKSKTTREEHSYLINFACRDELSNRMKNHP